jgi:hypothetical protein
MTTTELLDESDVVHVHVPDVGDAMAHHRHPVDAEAEGESAPLLRIDATGAQHLGQMDPVALAAGEHADLLLLVRSLEVERGHIGPGVHLT